MPPAEPTEPAVHPAARITGLPAAGIPADRRTGVTADCPNRSPGPLSGPFCRSAVQTAMPADCLNRSAGTRICRSVRNLCRAGPCRVVSAERRAADWLPSPGFTRHTRVKNRTDGMSISNRSSCFLSAGTPDPLQRTQLLPHERPDQPEYRPTGAALRVARLSHCRTMRPVYLGAGPDSCRAGPSARQAGPVSRPGRPVSGWGTAPFPTPRSPAHHAPRHHSAPRSPDSLPGHTGRRPRPGQAGAGATARRHALRRRSTPARTRPDPPRTHAHPHPHPHPVPAPVAGVRAEQRRRDGVRAQAGAATSSRSPASADSRSPSAATSAARAGSVTSLPRTAGTAMLGSRCSNSTDTRRSRSSRPDSV